jgi:hypothetical protein
MCGTLCSRVGFTLPSSQTLARAATEGRSCTSPDQNVVASALRVDVAAADKPKSWPGASSGIVSVLASSYPASSRVVRSNRRRSTRSAASSGWASAGTTNWCPSETYVVNGMPARPAPGSIVVGAPATSVVTRSPVIRVVVRFCVVLFGGVAGAAVLGAAVACGISTSASTNAAVNTHCRRTSAPLCRVTDEEGVVLHAAKIIGVASPPRMASASWSASATVRAQQRLAP